ncbi:MAG: hypothetical protein AB7I50_03415, partial [Vicinamibacterales bacterium]
MRKTPPRRSLRALILLASFFALSQGGESAAPHGSLDTGFSGDGKVTIPLGFAAAANGVAVQPDGKVILVGWTKPADDQFEDFAVARLNRDGSLDTSFSGDGVLTIDFTNINGARQDFATAVAIQPDGRIVVVGNSVQGNLGVADDFGIVRINPTGILDGSFGDGGKAMVDFGAGDVPAAVAIQRNGKIVVAGSTNVGGPDFALTRLTSAGTVDMAFGTAGQFRVDLTGSLAFDDVGRALALDDLVPGADASILVAGSTNGGTTSEDFFVVRVTPGGTLDSTFGTGGKALVDFGASDQATAIARQPDGKIVIAGTSANDFVVARLLANGTPDSAFSADGMTLAEIGGTATGVALLSNGKIVVGGLAVTNSFGMAMFSPSGAEDPGWGTFDSNLTIPFSGANGSGSMALQPDGQLVLVGSAGGSMAAVRVGAEQPLDLTFGTDGRQRTDSLKNEEGRGMLVQPDGKVVVAGPYLADLPFFGVARYKANGQLDPAFGGEGGVQAGVALGNFGATDVATAIARQADGKLVVVGYTNADGGPGPNNFAIMRLTTSGALDPTFNPLNVSGHGAGYLTIDFGADDRATAVTIQPDGKIIVAGFTNQNPAFTPP